MAEPFPISGLTLIPALPLNTEVPCSFGGKSYKLKVSQIVDLIPVQMGKTYMFDTVASEFTIEAPAGTDLDYIRIKATADLTINVGTFPGGSDVLSGEEITADVVAFIERRITFPTESILYFSGFSGSITSVKVVLQ